MSEKITIDLGNVQKTLFLPLWGRAIESKKENPRLIDQTALEIMEKVDYDFSDFGKNISELSQIAWIARSIYIDKTIKAFLAKYPKATIVNIGCGLDTTFERVDNGALIWYDLDLPDVISLRRQFIPETERRKFISTSFLEKSWLKEIQVDEQVLFVAAGVLYYFEEDEIRKFFIQLADVVPGSEIIFDVSSPMGVRVANRMVITSSGLDENSFLKWGLQDTKTILSWDKRLRILHIYYFFRQKGQHLTMKNKMLGLFSDFMKIQYMVHLELTK